MPVDWIISKEAIGTSTTKREFEHQMRWSFAVEPRETWQATSNIEDMSGAKLAPLGQQFHAVRSAVKTVCSLKKSSDRHYAASKKNICLFDSNGDGSFDQVALGNYKKSGQLVATGVSSNIAPITLAAVGRSATSSRLDGVIWVTAAIDFEVRMELFLGNTPFTKWCAIPGGRPQGADFASFECGITGLEVRVDNASGDRKKRRISLQLPKSDVTVIFGASDVTFH